ncbi:hypothetical protein [uncultured Campylobacter sp.]|uniref:hypothetical protein n=1 Tax=uncultured Campylobacter sp. TaxID=218934 RepID=UPI00262E1D6E|nr:hypothetical protein [uncultured Campylobacter sp.]
MILICTALRCEAQAIIESFKLTRSGDLFAGEQMLLYICGVRFGAKFKAGAEFGRELRKDRRGADLKFEHRLDAGALCGGGAETGSARNATKNFKILDLDSARNSERFGEILLSRRVDFALNIGVCGCEDTNVQIGEAFYFDGTAAQEFCGASLDGKLRANLICVSEPKILNAAERSGEANVAAIEACGEINAQAPTQGTNDAADTKNFTHDAVRAATQSATQVEAQNLASVKLSQIAVGGHSVATNTAARAAQNTPCTAKDAATCERANRDIRLYDMESALFVSVCERAGVPWAMMKIVSDHLRGERLGKGFVYELVKARLPQIRAAIKGKI